MFSARVLLPIFLLLSVSSAHAGLLFEPYAGYTMGDIKYTGSATNSDLAVRDLTFSGNIDGFAYGAKAGWIYSSFLFGAEYQAARAQKKMAGTDDAVNWTNTSVFGIVGLQFGGLRISAGTTVTKHRSEESTLPETTVYTGSAQKISIGYQYNVPFAVNADYIVYKFDKYEQGAAIGDVTDRLSKMNYSAILLSLSFPFEFGSR